MKLPTARGDTGVIVTRLSNSLKSDAAAKAIATQLAERLRHYWIFGPAQLADGPTCGGGGNRGE